MSGDGFSFEQRKVRGTDSNTLLRMHDQAKAVLTTSPSVQERGRAERAVLRISQELRRRHVSC
jgi:hypothetical protein